MDALCCGSAWLEAKMHVRRRKKVEGLQRGVSGAVWLPHCPLTSLRPVPTRGRDGTRPPCPTRSPLFIRAAT